MELGSVHNSNSLPTTSTTTHTVPITPAEGPLTSESYKELAFDSEPLSTKPVRRPTGWMTSLANRFKGRGAMDLKTGNRIIPISSSRSTPLIQPETGKPFVSNAVTTARYTLWDFLPKQLYAQFSKIANVYFLFVASLQMVPGWSTTGQYTTLVPLVVFLSIAIAHEGYDDLRRHRQDSGENNQPANVFRSYRNATNSISSHTQQPSTTSASAYPLPASASASASSRHPSNSPSGGTPTSPAELSITIPLTPATLAPTPNLAVFQQIKWKDLAVGDIVRVDQNDWVPADLILLHSSGADGGCYVETAALDGETNLKQRQALKMTNDVIQTPEDIATFTGRRRSLKPFVFCALFFVCIFTSWISIWCHLLEISRVCLGDKK